MIARLAVTGITTTDAVLRETAAMSVQADVPTAVVVRHDLHGTREGTMRRVVSDATGVLEDVTVALEHGCLSCALREDLLPTLLRLAVSERWSHALVALPLASEPVPFVRGLLHGTVGEADVSDALDLRGVVCLVDASEAVPGIMGADSLAERGIAHAGDDERSHGEVLVRQLRGADLVLASGTAGKATWALLEHLVPAAELRRSGAGETSGADLLAARHDAARSDRWEDPRRVQPPSAADRDGVWTLDLADWRPFHPERLHENLERLAVGSLVGHGRFWLPSRPGVVGLWEGAGGQLSIGEAGPWGGTPPSTHLVVTGLDEDPRGVEDAFRDCLLTDAELAGGLDRWTGREDGFDAWLGRIDEDAA